MVITLLFLRRDRASWFMALLNTFTVSTDSKHGWGQ